MMRNFKLESFLEPAPPKLSWLFGYRGAWRWIAFYWDGGGKGPCFPWHFDGHATGPVNRSAWEAFINHRLVLAHNYRREDGYAIKRFEFGSDRFASSHWLLLDRQERCLFAGPESEVAKFITLSMDQRPGKGAQGGAETALPDDSHDQIASDQDGAMKGISDMVSWLDRRVGILEKNGKWPIFH
jgi:hypothetical protein